MWLPMVPGSYAFHLTYPHSWSWNMEKHLHSAWAGVGWSYHISGDNFVAFLYGSVGHFFVLKLPKNLYSFKHFSTSQVRSGQIEPKLFERVVNQPQYSLNLAHLRGKPYDMGVYGCQSGNHEVNNLSRCFFVTSARIKLFQCFCYLISGNEFQWMRS